jgi:signal transduction histidine kinase
MDIDAWRPLAPRRAMRFGMSASLIAALVLAGHALVREVSTAALPWAVAACTVAGMAALSRVDWSRSMRVRHVLAFYGWSVLVTAAIGVYVATIGPSVSLAPLFALALVGNAATFPPHGQWVLQPYVLAVAAIVLGARHPVAVAVAQVAALGALAVLAYVIAQTLRRALDGAAAATAEADRRARLVTAVARTRSLDPEEVAFAVVDGVRTLGFDVANLGIVEADDVVPWVSLGWATDEIPEPMPVGQGVAGRAMLTGRIQTVPDYFDDPDRLPGRGGIRSAVAAPVIVDGEVLGVLIGGRGTPGEPTRGEVEVIEVLAEHAGQAIGLARRYDSEQMLVERLRELDTMKQRFLSNVSHELRTPLTVIHGLGVTLARVPDLLDQPKGARLLELMDENTSRLKDMLGSLLDESQLTVGELKVDKVPTDIADVLSRVVARLAPMLADHEVRVEAAGPTVALADAPLLAHVIENLVTNAVKHTPPGTHVTLAATPRDAVVHVEVRDTGPGIAPADLPRLTERFYQAAGNRGGFGVGLALAGEILAGHGCTLEVESEVGVGTVFSFALTRATLVGADA